MSIGLVGALAAALCYGIGSVLQAIGARRIASSAGVDPRLLWRLVRSLPYVAGLAMDTAGFALSLVALRTMPLFAVEAITSSYLAVVALLATWILRARLSGAEWLAVGAVVAGLAMLVVSTGPHGPATLHQRGHWALLGFGVVLTVAALAAGRTRGRAGALLLGVLAGLAYGLVGVATRVLREPISIAGLLEDPASYALALGGVLGMLLYATALQRGSATAATAATVAGETIVPALVGVLVLGDHSRPGLEWLALAGFAATVAGALALGRYGELEPAASARPDAALDVPSGPLPEPDPR